MHLETTPLLPVAACLTAGIAVGEGQGQGIPWPCILLVWIMLTLLCKRWALIQTIAIWTGCFLLGMSVIQCQSQHVVEGPVVEGIVMSEPAEKPKTIAVDLLVPGQGGQTMRCYLWKDERSRSLQLGDALVIDDYQGPFVRSRNWQQGGEARQQLSRWQRLRLWFLQERHRLLDRYQALNGDEAAYAVLAAMTLGDKSALTPELRETYSVSGASHVLALSGLHLGIIYMLLTWLSMGRRRYWLSQLLMVTAIWAFALLTGLSPSITRSATMISLYALFSTRSNGRVSLNIICFTAIVMLLADAHALFEVSFQLSFMAVLSIVTLMPLWNRVWQPRHPVANWLWQLTSMSVSAQLGVSRPTSC
jgi:competence protein ComEC